MPQDQIDINGALSKRATISIDPEETAEEHAARLKREGREALQELIKGYVLFFAFVIVLIALGVLCAFEAVFDATATADAKRVAWTMLSALFTGTVSFVLGQKTVKAK